MPIPKPQRSSAEISERMPLEHGRKPVVIESVRPDIDCGRFPIKRTVGEQVVVEADIFSTGHDDLAAVLRHRRDGEEEWRESAMRFVENDRWTASFEVEEIGTYLYTIEAWVDAFLSWQNSLRKRVKAGQDVGMDLLIGAGLVTEAAERADGSDRKALGEFSKRLKTSAGIAFDEKLNALIARYPDSSHVTALGRELIVSVDRERARFSSWYELFPRSASPDPERFGTLQDVIDRVPRVASMGFDILYLPPIHPIGRTHRKGKNNEPAAGPEDVGSPWAIGGPEGGHTAVHPDLGTIEDFDKLVDAAAAAGMEIAVDLAFQCSPDHPWVSEHPEWFRMRPDGTIQYAENPPKKYQDIFPLDFETPDWEALWQELKGVAEFWISHGVKAFRVDNPHTKPFPFWEWFFREIRSQHPEVIFLSEAFTRPKVMYRLAKLGFTQSYTYFAWRHTKRELIEYFTELTTTEVSEYFRPNLWPNTPDILTEYLQTGGRPAFMSRLVLAATLGASYGIYGPPFELSQTVPVRSGSEEYLDSEKYQVRHWNWDDPGSLGEFIALVNEIRHDNPALHSDRRLRFLPIENDHLIAYTKSTPEDTNLVLVVVNLDPYNAQSGWLQLGPEESGSQDEKPFEVHDLITGAHYWWQVPQSFIMLDPARCPAHIFRVRRRVRSEEDFEYFM